MDYAVLDRLKEELDSARPIPPEIMAVIEEKLRLEWTYHSNAIEGNTLTLQETAFFLKEGLTSKGKPFKDYLETRNHAEAIDWLTEIVHHQRPVSEGLIKEMNALLLKGIDYIWVGSGENKVKKPIYPGRYKVQPNQVLTIDGAIHYYCEPVLVPERMEGLIRYINTAPVHPLEKAAGAHYQLVAIHPFDDGNGRTARLLMNLILMQNGYLPAILKNENREDYYRALREADNGRIETFTGLIFNETINSLHSVLAIIRRSTSTKNGPITESDPA